MTRVYKIELLVVDHDSIGPDEASDALEGANYPNDCIAPKVVSVEERSVEWSDDHPLNRSAGWQEAYARLFKR